MSLLVERPLHHGSVRAPTVGRPEQLVKWKDSRSAECERPYIDRRGTAVNGDGGAGDVRGLGRQKPADETSDLVGLGWPTQWDIGRHRLVGTLSGCGLRGGKF